MTHLMNTYNRLPVAFTHGQGARLFDEHGKEYLDALAGIAVNGLANALLALHGVGFLCCAAALRFLRDVH